MASEVEETLKRLVGHKGVIGTIVVNNEGVPIKSTLDNATTVQYSGLLNNLVDQAKTMFKELDPTNDLTFLRIRTKVCPVSLTTSELLFSEARDHGGPGQGLSAYCHSEHPGRLTGQTGQICFTNFTNLLPKAVLLLLLVAVL